MAHDGHILIDLHRFVVADQRTLHHVVAPDSYRLVTERRPTTKTSVLRPRAAKRRLATGLDSSAILSLSIHTPYAHTDTNKSLP